MCAAVYRQRHLVKAMEVIAGLAESNGVKRNILNNDKKKSVKSRL